MKGANKMAVSKATFLDTMNKMKICMDALYLRKEDNQDDVLLDALATLENTLNAQQEEIAQLKQVIQEQKALIDSLQAQLNETNTLVWANS